MEQLKLDIMGYLPYGLKCVFIQDLRDDFYIEEWVEDIGIMNKGAVWQYAGYADNDLSIPLGEGYFSGFLIRNKNTYTCVGNSVKPILKPMTKEVLGEVFKNYTNKGIIEVYQDSRFIYNISSTARLVLYQGKLDNCPKWIIDLFNKHHVDYMDLIGRGLAIDKTTLKTK